MQDRYAPVNWADAWTGKGTPVSEPVTDWQKAVDALAARHEVVVLYAPHNYLSEHPLIILSETHSKRTLRQKSARYYLSPAEYASLRLGQVEYVLSRILPKLRRELGADVSLG